MSNFIIVATNPKVVMNKGVYPTRVIEFYLMSDKELKPKNKKSKRKVFEVNKL
jgi:hypothetical protein